MSEFEILCFGDSNTWGYVPVTGERYARDVRWSGRMAERLGPGFHVIEEGLSGRTTVFDDPVEGKEKNGLAYLPACLGSHAPLDLVILMLGTNDLKARFSLNALDISLGAERLVQVIRQSACGTGGRSPAILLAAPPPIDPPEGELAEMFDGGRETSFGLAGRYAAVAERCNCSFLDVGRHIAVDPADGIHYGAPAHEHLGEIMADRVRTIFADPSRARER